MVKSTSIILVSKDSCLLADIGHQFIDNFLPRRDVAGLGDHSACRSGGVVDRTTKSAKPRCPLYPIYNPLYFD